MSDRIWNYLFWNPAPEGIVLETKMHDMYGERNHARLIRRGNLWFLPDRPDTYVYYQPTHWRYPS